MTSFCLDSREKSGLIWRIPASAVSSGKLKMRQYTSHPINTTFPQCRLAKMGRQNNLIAELLWSRIWAEKPAGEQISMKAPVADLPGKCTLGCRTEETQQGKKT